MSGLAVVVLFAMGVACGKATIITPASPTASNSATQTTTGFFANGAVQLSYRLDIPAHSTPVGAVVFSHGSGKGTKDVCRIFGFADGFVARGYATLCFDKRGSGQSTGQYIPVVPLNSTTLFGELASDLAAGVEFLRSRPEIDRNRIGIAGVSEAGWTVPLAASKADPKFMLLIVGPATSLGAADFLLSLMHEPIEDAYRKLASFTGVHGFDPKPVLESLNVPGLWLLGGDDRIVPPIATVAVLDQLIASGKPYSHVVIPGVGHNLPPNWPEIDKWLAKAVQ